MRSFIGIDFSRQLKSEIAGLQSKLRGFATAGRWKYIDNFHLTLKFLDEVDSAQTAKIGEELQRICSETDRFTLNISELGNFAGKGSLRVLWLGLGGDLTSLNKLQAAIDSVLEKFGFEKEKGSYNPHVTIGQDIVFDRDFSRIKELANIKEFTQIYVDKVYFFKSEQIQNKRVYTPIQEYNLR